MILLSEIQHLAIWASLAEDLDQYEEITKLLVWELVDIGVGKEKHHCWYRDQERDLQPVECGHMTTLSTLVFIGYV